MITLLHFEEKNMSHIEAKENTLFKQRDDLDEYDDTYQLDMRRTKQIIRA